MACLAQHAINGSKLKLEDLADVGCKSNAMLRFLV